MEAGAAFQSPAGYYYEADGPDFGYTLNTHGSSARQAWRWLQGGPLAAVFRAGYYATFAFGEACVEKQRYGLGLVSTPRLGAVLQNQSGSATAVWGTRAENAQQTYESSRFDAELVGVSRETSDSPGIHRLDSSTLRVRYALGEQGRKTVTFDARGIEIAVEHQGAFSEFFPLLVAPDAKIELIANGAVLRAPTGSVEIRCDSPVRVESSDTAIAVGRKRVRTLRFDAADRLTCGVKFPAP